jgi:hypothetical protein
MLLNVAVYFLGDLVAQTAVLSDFLHEFERLWTEIVVLAQTCHTLREFAGSARIEL